MSEQRLQDLLHERVADTVTTDLATDAWHLAVRLRRRRAAAVAGGVAAVVAVVGGVAVAVSDGGADRPEPPVTTPSESRSSDEGEHGPQPEPAGEYGPAAVWWAPGVEQEDELPWLGGAPLPGSIDLSPGAPPAPQGVRATAVFQLAGDEPGRVVVLGTDGSSYSLDVSHLDPPDAEGNTAVQLTPNSLSPDGRYVFFVQPDSLEVHDLEDGEWTSIPDDYAETGQWDGGTIKVLAHPARRPRFLLYLPDGGRAGTTRELPPLSEGPDDRDQAYGSPRTHATAGAARSFHLAGPVPASDGGYVETAEAVVTSGSDGMAVLATVTGQGRWLQGLPVVGWLDSETVLFESRWEEAKVLAWRAGTADVYRVADIVGWTPGEESYVASFADLSGD